MGRSHAGPSPALAALLSAVAVLAAVAGGAAAAADRPVAAADRPAAADHSADAAPAAIADDGPLDALQGVDADSVLLRADVRADGDAAWTVQYRVELDDDNETAAFRTLQADVRTDPGNYTDRFAERMRASARAAENATGREMTVENVTVDTRLQGVPSYGIVTYRFEWTNFAAVDGELRAGDALSGLYLDGKTRLRIAWPEGYELAEATPDPGETGDRSVTWAGPTEFGEDEPRVVARPAGPLAGLPVAALAGGALLVVAAGAAALWWRRSADREAAGPEPATTPEPAAPEPDEPPEELLSNEERVLRLVAERGGRMKQQEIVEALDWTEAKTSQVVRDLRDEGELEGFRLGRENVLRLPGEDELDDQPGN